MSARAGGASYGKGRKQSFATRNINVRFRCIGRRNRIDLANLTPISELGWINRGVRDGTAKTKADDFEQIRSVFHP